MNKFLHCCEEFWSLQFYRTFQSYIHAKGSDLILGSFMQKALFGYETYILVDIIQGSEKQKPP